MTVNLVNVVVAADGSPADQTPSGLETPEGYAVAVPDGTRWPDANNLPIAPMVQKEALINGTATLQLVASDNYSAGVLAWDFIINIRGFPTVNVAQVPVNFASGATQSVWTILAAAGWTP